MIDAKKLEKRRIITSGDAIVAPVLAKYETVEESSKKDPFSNPIPIN
jgi:hypothetical protein